MSKLTAERYHDFSCGHRVFGHESKCAHLHGHNYRIHFTIEMQEFAGSEAQLDNLGRVMDFSVIKEVLCDWLERNWDHKFLLWKEDIWVSTLNMVDPEGIVIVPFNPTAENMAKYLVDFVGPFLFGTPHILDKYGVVTLTKCKVEETRKCSATYEV